MRAKSLFAVACMAGLVLFSWLPAAYGAALGKEEFVRRRQELMKMAGEGMILFFGNVDAPGPLRFRQDNDFYYFSGIEDKGAILAMIPAGGQTFLFLPEQRPREVMVEGANLLKTNGAAERFGLAAIHGISYFDEFLARNSEKYGPVLNLRLSPADAVDMDRYETRLVHARQWRSHYNDRVSLDQHRIGKLRERFPELAFRDVTPLVNRLRVIKSPAEIEILRRNGRISAEAVKRAMLASRPGGSEYEVEAAAVGWVLAGGARGLAFQPIVGSGPNTCTWHYEKNDRRMNTGELVLMDFGADLDYLCMDISRTWPVSGVFSAEQREVYRSVLEVEKACIAAYRPGVTAAEVEKQVAAELARLGVDARGLKGGIHHYVGLSTHDVGPVAMPLQAGMVFTIEPGLYYPEKNIGVRIEDTVLITGNGCEVLTAGAPKEIAEIETILRARKSRMPIRPIAEGR